MELKVLKIKKWLFDKIAREASAYNTWIDFDRDDNGLQVVEDGCVYACTREIIEETEKAVKVRLESGMVQGSYKGWATWLPKSCVEFVA